MSRTPVAATNRGPLGALRHRMIARVEKILYTDPFPGEQYDAPPGEPGLFGPGSVTWRVHGDPSMLIGGLAGVMLATLHPHAMAVVAERSSWREAPFHRLSRTASYIRATTYAATPVAKSVIGQVRAIHRTKAVDAPDGGQYRASDADLLTWVHVAEASCFLGAYQRYGRQRLSAAEENRYFAEVANVASLLGATDVPTSWAGVDRYFASVWPVLEATPAAIDSIRALEKEEFDSRALNAAYPLVMRAAIDLLPSWARRMLERPDQPVSVPLAAAVLVTAMRFGRGLPPAVVAAQRRCG